MPQITPKTKPPYVTRCARFLNEMEQIVPWTELLVLIEPYYPKGVGQGRRPYPLATRLRIYLLQQWYGYSDPGMEDALYEITSLRTFAQLDRCDGNVPDETTILNVRRLLEQQQLTAAIMNTINDMLEARGILLKGGTMVDATIIHAAPSTKNQAKTRDPEMHQTKKGHQWYFGMKIPIGADVHSQVVHTVAVTPANTADIQVLPTLLREDDRAVFGDAGYVNNTYKQAARKAGVFWGVALKAPPRRRLGASQKRHNRQLSSIRSRVEHVFRVIKCQFGYTRVRYKGLAKNAAHVFTLMGLANLYLKRRQLLAAGPTCA